IEKVFPSVCQFLRRVRSAAKRGTEIEKVMSEELSAVLVNVGVERIELLGVSVVHKCGDHIEAAKLAAVFVRDLVIRIVTANTDIRKRAFGFSFEKLARHG